MATWEERRGGGEEAEILEAAAAAATAPSILPLPCTAPISSLSELLSWQPAQIGSDPSGRGRRMDGMSVARRQLEERRARGSKGGVGLWGGSRRSIVKADEAGDGGGKVVEGSRVTERGKGEGRRTAVQRLLVCHDMRGGYTDEDKWVQGWQSYGGEDVFRILDWDVVDAFVYFSHHLVTIPPPCWTNAAHVHGVQVLGTFITEWEEGAGIVADLLSSEQRAEHCARQLVAVALFFNFDGWLINLENEVPLPLIPTLLFFLRRLTSLMHQAIPNSLVIWYDSVTSEGKLQWQDCLSPLNFCFFNSCDAIFTNYSWDEASSAPQRSCQLAGADRSGDVFMGVDLFVAEGRAGRGFDCRKWIKMAREGGASAALFAPGWVYETNQEPNFETANGKLWRSIREGWAPIAPHPCCSSLPLFTSFDQGLGPAMSIGGRGVSSKPWANLSCQTLQPVSLSIDMHPICSSPPAPPTSPDPHHSLQLTSGSRVAAGVTRCLSLLTSSAFEGSTAMAIITPHHLIRNNFDFSKSSDSWAAATSSQLSSLPPHLSAATLLRPSISLQPLEEGAGISSSSSCGIDDISRGGAAAAGCMRQLHVSYTVLRRFPEADLSLLLLFENSSRRDKTADISSDAELVECTGILRGAQGAAVRGRVTSELRNGGVVQLRSQHCEETEASGQLVRIRALYAAAGGDGRKEREGEEGKKLAAAELVGGGRRFLKDVPRGLESGQAASPAAAAGEGMEAAAGGKSGSSVGDWELRRYLVAVESEAAELTAVGLMTWRNDRPILGRQEVGSLYAVLSDGQDEERRGWSDVEHKEMRSSNHKDEGGEGREGKSKGGDLHEGGIANGVRGDDSSLDGDVSCLLGSVRISSASEEQCVESYLKHTVIDGWKIMNDCVVRLEHHAEVSVFLQWEEKLRDDKMALDGVIGATSLTSCCFMADRFDVHAIIETKKVADGEECWEQESTKWIGMAFVCAYVISQFRLELPVTTKRNDLRVHAGEEKERRVRFAIRSRMRCGARVPLSLCVLSPPLII